MMSQGASAAARRGEAREGIRQGNGHTCHSLTVLSKEELATKVCSVPPKEQPVTCTLYGLASGDRGPHAKASNRNSIEARSQKALCAYRGMVALQLLDTASGLEIPHPKAAVSRGRNSIEAVMRHADIQHCCSVSHLQTSR